MTNISHSNFILCPMFSYLQQYITIYIWQYIKVIFLYGSESKKYRIDFKYDLQSLFMSAEKIEIVMNIVERIYLISQ